MINTTVCITLFLISLSTLSCVAAQCPGPAGYLGAYDAFSGEFVGAVSRIFPSHQGLGNAGALSLDRTGNAANYLAVCQSSTVSTNEGDAALLQILDPGDANAPFLTLVVGLNDCSQPVFSKFANPYAFLSAGDGFPKGALPLPSTGQTTYGGGYGQLSVFCNEPMAFLVRSTFGRNTFQPVWTEPSGQQFPSFTVQDMTNNYLAVTPDPDIYAADNGAIIQALDLGIFI